MFSLSPVFGLFFCWGGRISASPHLQPGFSHRYGVLRLVHCCFVPRNLLIRFADSNIERRDFNAKVLIDWALRDTVWYVPLVHELAPGAEVWAGEDGPIGGGDDGSCINGGPKNDSACGLYATTLWYANDLGIRAKAGFAQYQRQDLLGGRYGLLSIPGDDQRLGSTDPVGIQPDFWINFM